MVCSYTCICKAMSAIKGMYSKYHVDVTASTNTNWLKSELLDSDLVTKLFCVTFKNDLINWLPDNLLLFAEIKKKKKSIWSLCNMSLAWHCLLLVQWLFQVMWAYTIDLEGRVQVIHHYESHMGRKLGCCLLKVVFTESTNTYFKVYAFLHCLKILETTRVRNTHSFFNLLFLPHVWWHHDPRWYQYCKSGFSL